MCTVFPTLTDPFCLAELVTITAMYSGSGLAGGGLAFPFAMLQPIPQFGGLDVRPKPLKLAGAAPPLRRLSLDHWEPQKVTADPVALLLSPIAKAPFPGGKPYTRTLQEEDVVLPPASRMFVVTLNLPVEPKV